MNNTTISVCIATLNAEKVLDECLELLSVQNYDKSEIELIAGDGGSTDRTLEILRKYEAKVYPNPLKTAEAGKAVAVKHAKNELILILDSDNFLPDKNWLKSMVKPFLDPDISMSEPIRYTWRKEGGYMERYSALIGMNDPVCLFIGNYDRWNYLTQKWTELPCVEEQKDGYIKVTLNKNGIPTIGANGTIFRKSFIDRTGIKDYLFDIDLIAKHIKDFGEIKIAKVDVGIIHTYCENSFKKFIRKQTRRVIDMNYYKKLGVRTFEWPSTNPLNRESLGITKFCLYTIFCVPLLIQSVIGYSRKNDLAWFIHYPACLVTMVIYIYYTLLLKIKDVEYKRSTWKQ